MLTRLVDFLKMKEVTAFFTHLTTSGGQLEGTDENVSSIMDSWLLLRDVEHGGQRSYALFVLKSRGMAHSHEMREFVLTDHGIRLGNIFTKELSSDSKPRSKKRAVAKTAASGGKNSGHRN